MAIASTKTQLLDSKYSTLAVEEISEPYRLPDVLKRVGEWWTKSFDIDGLDPRLSDYRTVASQSYKVMGSWLSTKKIPAGQRLLAAYDKDNKLQGIAITSFRKSRKNQNPFIEMRFLLTAFANAPFQKQKQVTGAGRALIAKTIQLVEKNKCIYASVLDSAKPFYVKMGFVETRRQIGHKDYKLVSADFKQFLSIPNVTQ